MNISYITSFQALDPPTVRSASAGSDPESWDKLLFDASAEVRLSEQPSLSNEQSTAMGGHSNVAEAKLTELLLAQTLRSILPKEQNQEDATAAETWRGMLADIVAETVASAMPPVVRLGQSSPGQAERG